MADTNGANLKEALEAQKLIKQFEEELASLETKRNTARARAQKEALKQQIDSHKTIIKNSKEYETYQKKISKETETFGKSWTKLSSSVQKNLGGTNRNATVYSSIAYKIIALEAKQAGLTGDELDANMEMVSRLREQNDSLVAQAKMTTTAEAKARGLNDTAIVKKELEEEITKAIEERNDELRESLELEKQALEQKDKLQKQEERLTSIADSQKSIMDSMPEGVQSSIGFAKKLGDTLKTAGKAAGAFMILATVVALALSSFTKLEESAKEFRQETGLTNSQMVGIRSDANDITGEFGKLGVEAKNVFDTVSALKSEFGDTVKFSKETTAALTVLNANFGVSADTAAKVQSQFEAIGGLSSETAANVQMQVANMANLAGVAPKKVFEDISENAEATSTFFKGDVKTLARQAVEARRLGTTLKQNVELAEKLLDFEGGIEEELVAATFVGGQFNLSQARALAYQGDLVGAQKETLAQLQRSGDFRKKDYFTQQQLAKAAGMSVEEINKQLNAQEKLNSLSYEERKLAEDAISKGLDITNINKDQLAQETNKFSKQQEMQTQLEKVTNSFQGMASVIGSTLIPLIDGIGIALTPVSLLVELIQFVFGGIGEKISSIIGPLGMVGKVLKGLAGLAVIYAAYSVFGWMTAATMGFGTIAAGIASAAILAAGFATLSKIGDMSSPADGKTQVSTKEGGLFELSDNDDLVAAPGAISRLNEASQLSKLSTAPMASANTNMGGIDTLVNEMKALRGDMTSGKIRTNTYLDGQKVSNSIGSSVDQNTRNSFNMSAT